MYDEKTQCAASTKIYTYTKTHKNTKHTKLSIHRWRKHTLDIKCKIAFINWLRTSPHSLELITLLRTLNVCVPPARLSLAHLFRFSPFSLIFSQTMQNYIAKSGYCHDISFVCCNSSVLWQKGEARITRFHYNVAKCLEHCTFDGEGVPSIGV